jgi:hypothetical protein
LDDILGKHRVEEFVAALRARQRPGPPPAVAGTDVRHIRQPVTISMAPPPRTPTTTTVSRAA